jgi:hypothetical protein
MERTVARSHLASVRRDCPGYRTASLLPVKDEISAARLSPGEINENTNEFHGRDKIERKRPMVVILWKLCVVVNLPKIVVGISNL